MYPFGQTGQLTIRWQLLLGGQQIRGGEGFVPSIPALKSQIVRFPFSVQEYMSKDTYIHDSSLRDLYFSALVKDLVLDIRIVQACADFGKWTENEVCVYQQNLATGISFSREELLFDNSSDKTVLEDILPMPSEKDEVTVSETSSQIKIHTQDTDIAFSKSCGGLTSFATGGFDFLAGEMKPSFYRAATNANRLDESFVLPGRLFAKETDWRSIQNSIRFVRSEHTIEGKEIFVKEYYKSYGMKGPIIVKYRFGTDEKLSVTISFTPRYDLIRYGFRVRIPLDADYLTWYGRGPLEAYMDRKASADMGLFTYRSAEMFHKYPRPSESGAHCDTRVLLLSDVSGKKMKITRTGDLPFSFSAMPYSPENIDDCYHQEQLVQGDMFDLFLDFSLEGNERNVQARKDLVRNRMYCDSFVFEHWKEYQSKI
jgi:hypothetical protein